MQNLKMLIAVMGGTLVLVFGMAYLFTSDSGEELKTFSVEELIGAGEHVTTGAQLSADVEPNEEEAEEATESAESSELVTLVEFSDFQCPACGAVHLSVKRLLAQNPDTVQFVYRHFPLESIHLNARAAAVAAEAAHEQGMFWEFHDELFERQEKWAEMSDTKDFFIELATELELDVELFTTDIEREDLSARVDNDITDGLSFGVNSTPTFYVNGEKVNVRDLELKIDSLLQAN